jgi:MoxR-like ATPase
MSTHTPTTKTAKALRPSAETPALPKCWQTFDDALNGGVKRVILFGPSGTGKTFAGLNFGDVQNGAYRLICTEDMTNVDVTGAFLPEGNTWAWVDGAALSAWRTGGRLVVDEIDKAGGDVFAELLAMLDSPESASWRNPRTNEIVRPKNGFTAVMTTNVEEMDELPPALIDRFPVRIRINEPHPTALNRLSKDLRPLAVQYSDAGERRISLRAFLEYDNLRKALGDMRAAEVVFAERAEGIVDAIKVNGVSS